MVIGLILYAYGIGAAFICTCFVHLALTGNLYPQDIRHAAAYALLSWISFFAAVSMLISKNE